MDSASVVCKSECKISEEDSYSTETNIEHFSQLHLPISRFVKTKRPKTSNTPYELGSPAEDPAKRPSFDLKNRYLAARHSRIRQEHRLREPRE